MASLRDFGRIKLNKENGRRKKIQLDALEERV